MESDGIYSSVPREAYGRLNKLRELLLVVPEERQGGTAA
jgi:hypothetical protein